MEVTTFFLSCGPVITEPALTFMLSARASHKGTVLEATRFPTGLYCSCSMQAVHPLLLAVLLLPTWFCGTLLGESLRAAAQDLGEAWGGWRLPPRALLLCSWFLLRGLAGEWEKGQR